MSNHIERLMRRVQHMVGVGRTTASVNEAGPVQTVQLQGMSGTPDDAVPVASLFGFVSSMPVGSDVTFLAVAGDSSARVAVTTGHQSSRYKGTPVGGSAMYDQSGSVFVMTNDHNAKLTLTGTFTIQIGDMTAVFSSSGLAITGGAITATGEITAGFGTAKFNTLLFHTHPTAAPGAPSIPTADT